VIELLNILLAFLLGSLPFGLWITRAGGIGDIRTIGSGNTGATNVLRTGRKDLAALTLLADASKGMVAVWIAYFILDAEPAIAAFCAVLGHCFTPWLNFRGGKGVATTMGVLIALSWAVGFMTGAIWIAVFFLTRISSLSALIAIGIAPFAMWIVEGPMAGTSALLIMALVMFRHQANIMRLVAGNEPKFEFGGKKE
jgi:glycerol-3-phosphate acyltransferase PlsY